MTTVVNRALNLSGGSRRRDAVTMLSDALGYEFSDDYLEALSGVRGGARKTDLAERIRRLGPGYIARIRAMPGSSDEALRGP